MNNPLQYADPYGLDWVDPLADWGAGFGDSYTLNLTRGMRRLVQYDNVVNYCSSGYMWGETTSTAVGLVEGAFAAAGAITKISAQMGRSRNVWLGIQRLFWDGRDWETIRTMYSQYVGGLRSQGLHLAHTFVRQSETYFPIGLRNAGLNYFEMSAKLNSWLGNHRTLEFVFGVGVGLGGVNMVKSIY